jgi:tetratricopeptide (TPR) repeat protein
MNYIAERASYQHNSRGLTALGAECYIQIMEKKPDPEKSEMDFEIRFFESLLKDKDDFVDALKPLADLYTRRGHIEKGLELDERLIKLCPNDPTVFYNLSCSYSLLLRPEESLNALRQAIVLGYSDLYHLLTDKDLQNIRKEPAFLDLVEAVKKNCDPSL